MAPVSSGIEKVRAFELPCGIRGDGNYIGLPRVVLVKWQSSWYDKLHQVYVNGQYAGATIDSLQRHLVIQISTSPEYPVRIEVLAVGGEEADSNFSSEIESFNCQTGRVKISMLRGQNLPIGATAQIYFDNGTGEINYEEPLTNMPIRVWPCLQDKAGFALGGFGKGDFGYDCGAAIGFGKGNFGQVQFGFNADTFTWTSPALQAGIYRFCVKVTDRAGNESSGSEAGQVTVTPTARPAEQASISSFDKQANQLVLIVS